ncbi:hypothetical protein JTB14_007411 [Gonioctena quinquepunctata]|nr:hypothetical protein JTB14_007411 [Gonioctena quinquepunctata]
MNRFIFSFVLLGVLAIVLAANKKYTTKYDNVDIDAILKNDRILKNYMDCCLGKRKCTPDGEELKSHIREAMDDQCENCSETQKKVMRKVGRKLYKDKPEWWKELCDHFDPEGKYQKKYQKFIDDALAEKDD